MYINGRISIGNDCATGSTIWAYRETYPRNGHWLVYVDMAHIFHGSRAVQLSATAVIDDFGTLVLIDQFQ